MALSKSKKKYDLFFYFLISVVTFFLLYLVFLPAHEYMYEWHLIDDDIIYYDTLLLSIAALVTLYILITIIVILVDGSLDDRKWSIFLSQFAAQIILLGILGFFVCTTPFIFVNIVISILLVIFGIAITVFAFQLLKDSKRNVPNTRRLITIFMQIGGLVLMMFIISMVFH
jgi:hypothetical protein